MVRDFNYPYIDWSVPINTGSCILQNGFTQVVNLPTRDNNCIDLVMVSDVRVSDADMMLDIC